MRLVSFPSWELFNQQDETYRDLVLPPSIKKRLAVEAGVSLGWSRWIGDGGKMVSVDRFGASAPAGKIFEEFSKCFFGLIRGWRVIESNANLKDCEIDIIYDISEGPEMLTRRMGDNIYVES